MRKKKLQQFMLVRTITGHYLITPFSMYVYFNPFNTIIIVGTESICIDTLSKIKGQS